MATRKASTKGGIGALDPLAEALLHMYDPATAGQMMADLIGSDDPMRALLRLANRRVARDWGVEAAGCLVELGARVIPAAGLRNRPRTRPART